jgi:hypothetical protein
MDRRDALKVIAATGLSIITESCVPQVHPKGTTLEKLDDNRWLATALICDTPNKNNRIYPKEIVQNAILEYNKTINEKTALGMLGNSNDATIHLQDVSHSVNKIHMDDANLKVEIEIMHTPPGQLLKNLLENPQNIAFRTQGIGWGTVNENNILIINKYSLISINALPANEAS